MRRPASAAAMLLLVAPAAPPSTALAQDALDTGVVTVIDAGDEPRHELRYKWIDEHTEQIRADMSVDIEAVEGGVPVMFMRLPISMTIRARVTDVADDGRARVAMLFDDISFGPLEASGGGLGDGEAASAAFDETMDEAVQLMNGIRTWQVMDDRGTVLRSGMDLPPGFPAEVEEQLAQATGSIPVLPEEPVGLGAIWETTATTANQGVSLAVTTVTQVAGITGNEVRLESTLRMADGAAASPTSADIFDFFDVQGSGTSVLDLAGIFPRDLLYELGMTMAGNVPADAGGAVPLEMSVGVNMTMESEPLD